MRIFGRQQAPDPGIVQADIVEKVNAGAALAYAIYHLPADTHRQLLDITPDWFPRALARAQSAYGVGHHGPLYISGAPSLDPLKAVKD
jgi:hypothetical protein